MAEQANEPIRAYEPLFGSWKIQEKIGSGSFGVVYRVSKEEMGETYQSAVKLITIPSGDQYSEAELTVGDDENTLRIYFEDVIKNIINEVRVLHSLSGNTNIVGYLDHAVKKHENGIGWDILIRMEYVTSLRKYLKEHRLTLSEVLQLGMDICTALELCNQKGIIHRDIKDDNIFVNQDGAFKLGDFGIAREMTKSGRAVSMRGTPFYMAPEVFRGDKYDATVDIYSLGIVLYKLLNNGRMPFMPDWPGEARVSDGDLALERRYSGDAMPAPMMAGQDLSAAILKACAFRPADRYRTAREFKDALGCVLATLDEARKSAPVLPEARKAGLSMPVQGESGAYPPADFAPLSPQADGNRTVSMFSAAQKTGTILQSAESSAQCSREGLPKADVPPATSLAQGPGLKNDQNPKPNPIASSLPDQRAEQATQTQRPAAREQGPARGALFPWGKPKPEPVIQHVGSKLILVCSATRRAGSSLIALNLARYLSKGSLSVGLIELPIDRPMLYQLAFMERKILENYSGKETDKDIIVSAFVCMAHEIMNGRQIVSRNLDANRDGNLTYFVIAPGKQEAPGQWTAAHTEALLKAAHSSISIVDVGGYLDVPAVQPLLAQADAIISLIEPVVPEWHGCPGVEFAKGLQDKGYPVLFAANKTTARSRTWEMESHLQIKTMPIPYVNPELVQHTTHEGAYLVDKSREFASALHHIGQSILPRELSGARFIK